MNPTLPFVLRGEYITLDALLKATGLVGSGGAAKVLIADGQVRVNGDVELRRGRKLRASDRVDCGQSSVRLMSASTDSAPL